MVITMVTQVDCLVSGGLLVTGKGVERADIAIKDGIIIEISQEIKEVQASRTIDAHNKYVLPGAIDAHCHPVYADKMDTMSLCAAYGLRRLRNFYNFPFIVHFPEVGFPQ